MSDKTIYMHLIRTIAKLSSKKKKNYIVVLASFPKTAQLAFDLSTTSKLFNIQFIVLHTQFPNHTESNVNIKRWDLRTCNYVYLPLELSKPAVKITGIDTVKNIHLMMHSKAIICDNYYPFLAGLHLKNTPIFQIWHADGAVKGFGWTSPKTYLRSTEDKKRFQAVYDATTDYVVGSKKMGQVFEKSYKAPKNKIDVIGAPQTDKFFDKHERWQLNLNIANEIPNLYYQDSLGVYHRRRIILYMPTYRVHNNKVQVPFADKKKDTQLVDALLSDKDAMIIIANHPVTKQAPMAVDTHSFLNRPNIVKLNEEPYQLLQIADTLITDYSSVMFDYALLKNAKQLIVFMPDIKQYKRQTGLQKGILKELPVKPVTTYQGLTKAIQAYKKTDFTKFNKLWNTYNDGHAMKRFANLILKRIKQQ